MKRITSLLLLILIVTGCSKESDMAEDPMSVERVSSTEPEVLEFLVYANQGMMKNYETVLKQFNDTHIDIQVEINNVYGQDWTDFEQTFRSYLLSGKSPDIVDISVIYRDSMIDEGLFLDLMPYAEKSGLDFELYFENQFHGLLRGDALYGIPSGAMLMGVFINKELFQKAGVEIPGLDWNNTWTWEEFAEVSGKFTSLSTPDNQIYGMTMSFTVGWLIPFIWGGGSDFLAIDLDDCSAVRARVVESVGYIYDLMFVQNTSPGLMELITLQPYQYFLNGNLAMTVDGNWWMEGFRDSIDFDWGVVPLPIGEKITTGMYVDCWAIPYTSEKSEAAFEVLKFFLEEQQQKSGIMKGIPPLKSSAAEIYRNRFPRMSEEEINVWFQGIEIGQVPAYFSGWSLFQSETTDILNKLGLGELTLDEAIDQICNSYMNNNKK